MHLRAHGHLDDKPGGVPQDEGGDEVPVDDVPQAADAPVRITEEGKLKCLCFSFNISVFFFSCRALVKKFNFMLREKIKNKKY